MSAYQERTWSGVTLASSRWPKAGLSLFLMEQFVLLAGAGPDIGPLGQPEIGVAGERDPAELGIDPVASSRWTAETASRKAWASAF